MQIEPDTKDWTFVLHEVCPECRFDVRSFPVEEVGAMIRSTAAKWERLLADPRARQRPAGNVWSALEYGCHVRDVFRLYDHRLQRMLEENDPDYENWDQDAAAIAARYSEQDPATVAKEMATAARALADRFDSVQGQRWKRTGNRSDGARFTVETFARYLIHDPIHHIHDVENGYRTL